MRYLTKYNESVDKNSTLISEVEGYKSDIIKKIEFLEGKAPGYSEEGDINFNI